MGNKNNNSKEKNIPLSTPFGHQKTLYPLSKGYMEFEFYLDFRKGSKFNKVVHSNLFKDWKLKDILFATTKVLM